MIERRPRAPVLRSSAFLAMADKSARTNLQFNIFHVEQLLVLLDQRVLRFGQNLDEGIRLQFL